MAKFAINQNRLPMMNTRIQLTSQRSRETTLSDVVCDFTVAHRKSWWLVAVG